MRRTRNTHQQRQMPWRRETFVVLILVLAIHPLNAYLCDSLPAQNWESLLQIIEDSYGSGFALLCPFEITGNDCPSSALSPGYTVPSWTEMYILCESHYAVGPAQLDEAGSQGGCIIDCPGTHFQVDEHASFSIDSFVLRGSNSTAVKVKPDGTFSSFNSYFEANSNERGNGGAIFADEQSHVSIGQTSFHNNTASSGGALFLLGDAEIDNAVFSKNKATSRGLDAGGGAIYAGPKAEVSVTNSLLANNSAPTFGPAVLDLTGGNFTESSNTACGNVAYEVLMRCNGALSIEDGIDICSPFEDACPESLFVTAMPTGSPTSDAPSLAPTRQPSTMPSAPPTPIASMNPSTSPTSIPSDAPSLLPSVSSVAPSSIPTIEPSVSPSPMPTHPPSIEPSTIPTATAVPDIAKFATADQSIAAMPSSAPTPPTAALPAPTTGSAPVGSDQPSTTSSPSPIMVDGDVGDLYFEDSYYGTPFVPVTLDPSDASLSTENPEEVVEPSFIVTESFTDATLNECPPVTAEPLPSGGSFSQGSIARGTGLLEHPELSSCGPAGSMKDGGVWYSVQQGSGTVMTAHTCSIFFESLNFDTDIAIFRSSAPIETPCLHDLQCVAAHYAFCGQHSSVSWYAEQGTTYYIYVAERGSEANSGTSIVHSSGLQHPYSLTVSPTPGGSCSAALDMDPHPMSGEFLLEDPGMNLLTLGGSIWYGIGQGTGQWIMVSTCLSNLASARISIYQGSCTGSGSEELHQVEMIETTCGSDGYFVTWLSQPDRTYYVRAEVENNDGGS